MLTGQSDPRSCALSPVQRRFLSMLAGPGRELMHNNFPYRDMGPYSPTPLLMASWNNLRQYFESRRASFRRQNASHVEAVIAQAPQTIFVCGSCGLELFNNLQLPKTMEQRCHLICYGPVARRPPAYAHHIVFQGRGDWLSRSIFPGLSQKVGCGHLDYLREPSFPQLCRDWIDSLYQKS